MGAAADPKEDVGGCHDCISRGGEAELSCGGWKYLITGALFTEKHFSEVKYHRLYAKVFVLLFQEQLYKSSRAAHIQCWDGQGEHPHGQSRSPAEVQQHTVSP